MSEHLYEHSLLIAAPAERVARFFNDGDAWYRLNPEWEVLSFARAADQHLLKVRYERSEQEAEYCRPVSTDFPITGGEITFTGEPARTIALALTAHGDTHTRLDWREVFVSPIESARRA